MLLLGLKTTIVAKKTFIIEAAERWKKVLVRDASSYRIYSIDAEDFNCSKDDIRMRSYEGKITFCHRSGEARFMASKTSKMTGQQLSDVVDELFRDTAQTISNL